MDSVRNGLTKDWLVTDECDPAENGCRGGSKSMENNMPSGAVREGQCPSFEECHVTSEELDLKNNSSLPKSIESCNPFEIEPGHFDFLQVADTYSSRQFSSDPGSAKGSSTKGDSSTSVRRHSNQSAST